MTTITSADYKAAAALIRDYWLGAGHEQMHELADYMEIHEKNGGTFVHHFAAYRERAEVNVSNLKASIAILNKQSGELAAELSSSRQRVVLLEKALTDVIPYTEPARLRGGSTGGGNGDAPQSYREGGEARHRPPRRAKDMSDELRSAGSDHERLFLCNMARKIETCLNAELVKSLVITDIWCSWNVVTLHHLDLGDIEIVVRMKS